MSKANLQPAHKQVYCLHSSAKSVHNSRGEKKTAIHLPTCSYTYLATHI